MEQSRLEHIASQNPEALILGHTRAELIEILQQFSGAQESIDQQIDSIKHFCCHEDSETYHLESNVDWLKSFLKDVSAKGNFPTPAIVNGRDNMLWIEWGELSSGQKVHWPFTTYAEFEFESRKIRMYLGADDNETEETEIELDLDDDQAVEKFVEFFGKIFI